MILEFADITPDEFAETLWSSFMSARLCREDALRALDPRPEWSNQDEDTKALWYAFAARLRAFYSRGLVFAREHCWEHPMDRLPFSPGYSPERRCTVCGRDEYSAGLQGSPCPGPPQLNLSKKSST